MRGSLQSYRKVSIETQIADASPHKITQMLMAGALERIAQTRYAIESKDVARKGETLNKAIGIVQGLKSCLVVEGEGSVGNNLSDLYDFIISGLSQVNIDNDVQLLDDVSSVLRTIKEGWDAIPQEEHHITAHAS